MDSEKESCIGIAEVYRNVKLGSLKGTANSDYGYVVVIYNLLSYNTYIVLYNYLPQQHFHHALVEPTLHQNPIKHPIS